MANQIKLMAAASLLICVSVFVVDVVDGGRCQYIPFCDECTYSSATRKATCTKCEASNLYGLTTENGFSRCSSCSKRAGTDIDTGCLKCKTFERCDMCRFPSTHGPDFDGEATCSPCAENCRNCTLSGSGKCNHCHAGYRLAGDSCEKCAVPKCNYCQSSSVRCSACASGYYLEDNQCKACVSNCKACSNSDRCSLCNDFYFLETDTGLCKACTDTNCKKCKDFGDCQICKLSYYLDNAGKCNACEDNCLVCMGKGKCTYCKKGRPFEGSCSCAPNCKSCDNAGFGKCDSCGNGYVQSESKGCKRIGEADNQS